MLLGVFVAVVVFVFVCCFYSLFVVDVVVVCTFV